MSLDRHTEISLGTSISERIGLMRSLVIYYGQPWRRRSLKRFYRKLVSPGDLVFDIGAHVGSRSLTLSDLGAQVVAVEPQPLFAAFLRRYLAGKLKALETVAVGARPGEVALQVSSLHPTVSSASNDFISQVGTTDGFRHVSWNRTIQVQMTSLDELIERHGPPAFCKIDVEGAEIDILNGLSQPLPLIAFEYVPAAVDLSLACVNQLAEIGTYEFNRVSGESHQFASETWMSSSEICAFLSSLHPGASSGDIYARQVR